MHGDTEINALSETKNTLAFYVVKMQVTVTIWIVRTHRCKDDHARTGPETLVLKLTLFKYCS